MNKIKRHIVLFFKGLCMGIADVIPGVSGGTVAFLLGIYEDWIEAISSVDVLFFKMLLQGKASKAFLKVRWKFLLILFSGIFTAIFFLSHVLKWLLEEQTVFVYSFFFGIIFSTVFIIIEKIREKNIFKVIVGFLSAFIMYQLAGALPLQTPETGWFLFLSGAIAICAMILPGISGAFILLLLGKYEFVITAVSERNLGVLAIVTAGCCAGLLSFVRILRWLLQKHYDVTLSVLAGIVLGSLRRIRPWKEGLLYTTLSETQGVGPKEVNVLPSEVTAHVAFAFALLFSGITIGLLCTGKARNFVNSKTGNPINNEDI